MIFDLLLQQAALEPVTAPTLAQRMLADRYFPTSAEFEVTIEELIFRGQRGRHPVTGDVRIYWAPVDDPGAIGWVPERNLAVFDDS